jgi:hypothetical protein
MPGSVAVAEGSAPAEKGAVALPGHVPSATTARVPLRRPEPVGDLRVLFAVARSSPPLTLAPSGSVVP